MKLTLEQYSYWIFWIISVVYALYCVGEIRKGIVSNVQNLDDYPKLFFSDVEFPDDFFDDTWLGKRDRTDFEWETWFQNALKASPFWIINFIVSAFISSWTVI